MAALVFRITLGAGRALGPGKIRLLELIRDTGSISAAGRELDMSYRRAWLLVDDMNRTFRQPVVATKLGGRAGGGASLTPFGEGLVARYRLMADLADAALREHLDFLEAATTPPDGTEAAGVRARPLTPSAGRRPGPSRS